MNGQPRQIAIFGTFDVENYGDLLFPLIAEAELTQRLGPIHMHRFSYHAKSISDWPYEVTSLTELPSLAAQLDAILIGGGFIVRFDKYVAAGYGPPSADIHHPTGYWLTPALIAAQQGIPLIWNAPGMHCNDVPRWAVPLLRLALTHSAHVRVRDQPSQHTLASLGTEAQIQVLPDTAFGLARLIDICHPSPRFAQLRAQAGLTKPYLVVQAAQNGLDYFIQLVEQQPERFGGIQLLALPIGPVLGDQVEWLTQRIPGMVCLPAWPDPLLLAECIAHAQGAIGHSYHLSITALVFGVPVFSSADLTAGKYTALSDFDALYALPRDRAIDADWFFSRLGRKEAAPAVPRAMEQLSAHWDRVATLVQQGRQPVPVESHRFMQGLPALLEAPWQRIEALETEWDEKLQQANHTWQHQVDQLNAQISSFQAQLSVENLDTQASVSDLTERLRASEAQRDEDNQGWQQRMQEWSARLADIYAQQQQEEQAYQYQVAELTTRLEEASRQLEAEQQAWSARLAEIDAQQRQEGQAYQCQVTELTARLEEALCQLEAERQAHRADQAHLNAVYDSRSMRLTAPLRSAVRGLKHLAGR